MSEHWKIDAHMYREELIYVHSIYNSNKISKSLTIYHRHYLLSKQIHSSAETHRYPQINA